MRYYYVIRISKYLAFASDSKVTTEPMRIMNESMDRLTVKTMRNVGAKFRTIQAIYEELKKLLRQSKAAPMPDKLVYLHLAD